MKEKIRKGEEYFKEDIETDILNDVYAKISPINYKGEIISH